MRRSADFPESKQSETFASSQEPGDVEQLIGNSYGAEHAATLGSGGASGNSSDIRPMMLVMSFESSSSLANYCNGTRQAIPRVSTGNSRGNACQTENAQTFQSLQRVARTAANGLVNVNKTGFTLGNATQDLRAKAFGYFVLGVANGDEMMAHDSLSFVSETDTLGGAVKPLIGSKTSMGLALGQLDSAIAVTNRAIALGGFTLPSNWVNGNALTSAQFIQLIRSYKARFRAGVARTPTERAAVDWDQVIADAAAGITSDLLITMDPATQWTIGDGQHYTFNTRASAIANDHRNGGQRSCWLPRCEYGLL